MSTTSRSRQAARAAFDDVPETCPIVDSVLATLADRYDIRPEDIANAGNIIKEKATIRLRNALADAHEARLEAEAERDELRQQLDAAREDVASLSDRLQDANQALEEAACTA